MTGPGFPAGSTVALKSVPPGFLDDLPEEDKTAILAVIGKPVKLNGYEGGRAELEFVDGNDCIHFLYVSPEHIEQSPASEGGRYKPLRCVGTAGA